MPETYTVPPNARRVRADKVLAQAFPAHSRAALQRAFDAGLVCRECLEEQLGPPVDLLIRTGGEQRLSDFLLWECAYAELIFSRRMWPDFDASGLEAAVRQFHARQRRFGAIPPMPAVAATTHAWLD